MAGAVCRILELRDRLWLSFLTHRKALSKSEELLFVLPSRALRLRGSTCSQVVEIVMATATATDTDADTVTVTVASMRTFSRQPARGVPGRDKTDKT